MKYAHINGFDMAFIEIGRGRPLVCIHGTCCDYRVWSSVLGPLSRERRVIAISLRYFFPEVWSGLDGDFTITWHVADTIQFIEALDGPVDLLGHSRGGHIAFRIAQQRPDLLHHLVLAEPGGDLDSSLLSDTEVPSAWVHALVAPAAEKVAAGDIDGGLKVYVDALQGPGAWERVSATARQELRDNAYTLLGQVREFRQPFSRSDAEAIRVPTLFIGGAETAGPLPIVLRKLAGHVPGCRLEIIPETTHVMFEQDPVRFAAVVLDFLRTKCRAGRSTSTL
jgi:pimeloyl-ACP methyl ester carboxylesterase